MKYVAIRIEPDGSLYMSKTFFTRFHEDEAKKYNYQKIQVSDEEFENLTIDDFIVSAGVVYFNKELYNSRTSKQKEELRLQEYESYIINAIRKRYSINKEFAILRQRDSKPQEFYEYDNYVELCKAEAKSKFNL